MPVEDTLTVYYDGRVHTDTIHSPLFGKTVYSRQFRARINPSELGPVVDTTIGRFVFFSNVFGAWHSSDSGNIQMRLLTETLAEAYTKNNNQPAIRPMIQWVDQKENIYFAACNELWSGWQTLRMGSFYACLTAALMMVMWSFVAFFGLRIFAIGLLVPCAFIALYYLSASWKILKPDYFTSLTWGLLVLGGILTLIRQRRKSDLVLFQICSYALLSIIGLFPFEMNRHFGSRSLGHPAPIIAEGSSILVAVPILLLLLFTVFVTERAYKLYSLPME